MPGVCTAGATAAEALPSGLGGKAVTLRAPCEHICASGSHVGTAPLGHAGHMCSSCEGTEPLLELLQVPPAVPGLLSHGPLRPEASSPEAAHGQAVCRGLLPTDSRRPRPQLHGSLLCTSLGGLLPLVDGLYCACKAAPGARCWRPGPVVLVGASVRGA